ncbi:MAG: hypothetical protein JNN11_03655 [Candidatus Doudnabacteria bacterium]|nr:hypothetical protein [Candidatus Doudnabacteria bacterium]
MEQIQNIYLQFLGNFPESTRPVVSIALAVFLVYSAIKVLKKDWIFLVGLVVLLPASVPILKNVWSALVSIVKFLLNTK